MDSKSQLLALVTALIAMAGLSHSDNFGLSKRAIAAYYLPLNG